MRRTGAAFGSLYAAVILTLFSGACATAVQAQRVSLWLDANASSTRPPAGIGGDDAAYGTLGARLEARLSSAFTLNAVAQAGTGARTADGRWLYGDATAALQQSVGPVRLLLDLTGFGLRYTEPFSYDARAVRAQPGISIPLGALRISARADALRGTWSSAAESEPTLPLPGVPVTESRIEGDLQLDGGIVTVGVTQSGLSLEVDGYAHDVTNGVLDGSYRGVRASAALRLGRVSAFGGASFQQTEEEDELGFHVGAVASVGERVQLVGAVTQAVTDPVFGTRAGLGVSLGASVLLGSSGPPEPLRLVQIGPASGARRSVQVQLPRPDLTSVAIAGSFNDWTPVAMERTADGWSIGLSLEPGTYQFAFRRADGTWFVPEDAQGIVDDGFGQQNATLVVPPV